MQELLFAILFFICYFGTGSYACAYDRRSLWLVIGLMALSVASLYYWPIAALFLAPLALTFWRRLPFTGLAAFCMFGAVGVAFLLYNVFAVAEIPGLFWLAFASVAGICLLGIAGIFQDDLWWFLSISNKIQILYVLLDLSVIKMLGGFSSGANIQIFNYTLAGLTLFLTLGLLSFGKMRVSQLEGSWFRNKWNDAFATVACLSLAGLPAFNMFVGEWALFTSSFVVAPVITLLGIFAALTLFIMYYKVVYALLVGEGRPRHVSRPLTAVNGALAASCIALGLLPWLQWWILGAF
jgi:formate hydrogenlyase subunit 3/multisubunit Na+/H+ antiporter MnhD subunit